MSILAELFLWLAIIFGLWWLVLISNKNKGVKYSWIEKKKKRFTK